MLWQYCFKTFTSNTAELLFWYGLNLLCITPYFFHLWGTILIFNKNNFHWNGLLLWLEIQFFYSQSHACKNSLQWDGPRRRVHITPSKLVSVYQFCCVTGGSLREQLLYRQIRPGRVLWCDGLGSELWPLGLGRLPDSQPSY